MSLHKPRKPIDSLHKDIETALQIERDKLGSIKDIAPATLALAVQKRFKGRGRKIEPHIQYTSFEHLKQMARKILRRFEPDSDESQSIQGEMFSGHLQDRYPIPHAPDEDPIYRLREALTYEEAKWNCVRLRKSIVARMEHADALQAWNENRGGVGVAA